MFLRTYHNFAREFKEKNVFANKLESITKYITNSGKEEKNRCNYVPRKGNK